MNSSISSSEIVQYYDTCEIDYKWLWHLNDNHAMHYGYWKEDTKLLRDSLRNMNDYVMDTLEVQDGHQILDAGCGVGGTSIHISERYNASVHGITLSEQQVQTASTLAQQINLQGDAQFSAQNYCHTNFDASSFDRVYGIESICHANEKADFLKESNRVLKKDGILVVADFFTTGNYKNEKDKNLIANWANSWAVPSFEPWKDFITKAENNGLQLISNENITENIKKSAKRLYMMFYPGIAAHTVAKYLRIRDDVQGRNVWSTYYQYVSLKRKLWEYRVLKFTKK